MLETATGTTARAGLTPPAIAGIDPPPGYTTVEELAPNPGVPDVRYSGTAHMGGASPSSGSVHAATAVAAGVADTVLVVVGWNGYSAFRHRPDARRPRRGLDASAVADTVVDFYLPYGARAAVQYYAWIATRHQQLYGTLPTDMG